MRKHPIQQPVMVGEVLRFTENTIVSRMLELLSDRGFDLNDLHVDCHDHSREDWDQFNQLHGYSVSGAPICEDTREVAHMMHDSKLSEHEARALHAEELLQQTRSDLKETVVRLFGIHPDDLIVP